MQVSKIRLLKVGELNSLDGLIAKGGVAINSDDTVAVAEINGKIVGCMAIRVLPYVHSFQTTGEVNRRLVAESLFNYFMGAATAKGYKGAMLYIDKSNEPMIKFMKEEGAYLYVNSDMQDLYFIETR